MNRTGRVHIIGAGLAGLASALKLAGRGLAVSLHEAAGHAGGRCRSYFDGQLGRLIDNGNHLLVGGNRAAMAYIGAIGAAGEFVVADRARYLFLDLADCTRWTIHPNDGPWPWWILCPARRVAGSRPWDYRAWRNLVTASADATIEDCLDRGSNLYRRFWAPMAVAALNTEPAAASACLLGAVFAETFAAGGAGLHPLLPKRGLSESLIDPALAHLAARGVEIRFGQRLQRFLFADGNRIAGLDFGKGAIDLAPEDRVILAVPPILAAELLPDLVVPLESRAILNCHFAVEDMPGPAYSFIGLIGGLAEWVFLKPGIISTTTSAADARLDQPNEKLAEALWRDVAAAYGLGAALPPWRVLKEKRATFAATPAQLKRRPGSGTRWRNLFLAGDWTATGWPATIEGAIRSGFAAATAIEAATPSISRR